MAKPNSGSVTSEPQLFYLLQCTEFHGGSLDFSLCGLVTEQTRGVNNILLLKGPPLSLWGSPHLLGSPCLPPEERCLSMPEIGEKELFI